MNIYRKKIILSFLIALTTAFTGCSENSHNSKINDSQTDKTNISQIQIKNYQCTKLQDIEFSKSNIENFINYKDDMYFLKSSFEWEGKVLLCDASGTETYMTVDSDFYKAAYNKNQSFCISSGKMYLLYDYNSNGEILVQNIDTGTVVNRIKYEDQWGCETGNSLYPDGRGNIYRFYSQHSINGRQRYIAIYDENFNLNDTIDLNILYSDDKEWNICSFCADGDEVFLLVYCGNGYKAMKININSRKLIESKDISGMDTPSQIFINSEGKLYVYDNNEDTGITFINEISRESLDTVEMYNVSVTGNIHPYPGDADMIIISDDVQKYNIADNTFEPIDKDPHGLRQIVSFGDTMAFLYDNSHADCSLYKVDKNDSKNERFSVTGSDETYYICDSFLNNDGHLICVITNNEKNILSDINLENKELKKTELDIDDNREFISFTYGSDGCYYFLTADRDFYTHYYITAYDDKMNKISDITLDDHIEKILFFNSELCSVCYENGKYCIKKVDKDKKRIEPIPESTITSFDNYYIQGDKLLIVNNNILYQNTSGYEFEAVLDLQESGYYSAPNFIRCLDDGSYAVCSEENLSILSEAPENYKQPDTLTIAVNNSGFWNRFIKEFKSKNNNISIKIIEYPEQDYLIDKLNRDIISGNVPDIITLNNSIEVFKNKGLLADLSESFSDKDEFLTNILRACSSDGKINCIPTSFNVATLIGRSSDVGNEQGWRFDEFKKFIEKNSGKQIFYNEHDFLSMSTFKAEKIPSLVLSDFIDTTSMKYGFDSNFEYILELVKKYRSDEYNQKENDKNILAESYDNRFKNEKCILEASRIGGIGQLQSLQDNTVKQPITLKGFPSEKSSGSYVIPESLFAVSETCKNKEAAIEFIKFFLEEENQNKIASNGTSFPVRRETFYETLDNCEMCDTRLKTQLKQCIENISNSVLSNSDVTKIFDEQTDLFMNGTITSKKMISDTEKKMKIYLSEISD